MGLYDPGGHGLWAGERLQSGLVKHPGSKRTFLPRVFKLLEMNGRLI
jgi:hypothetical protein